MSKFVDTISYPVRNLRSVLKVGTVIEFRIMAVIAMAAATANTIGFLANVLLYGIDIPSAFCAFCDICAIIFLCFGLKPQTYKWAGTILLGLLLAVEFPLLVFAYGPVMYPYIVMGIATLIILSNKQNRKIILPLGIAYYTAVIVISTFNSYIFGPQDPVGLLGSAVVTFIVSVVTITVMISMTRNISINMAMEKDPITDTLSRNGFEIYAANYLEKNPTKDLAILYIDIKDFKSVNAIYGIDGGNLLLQNVSNRIKDSKLNPVFIARISADHFVCLVEQSNIDTSEINRICRFKFSEKGKLFIVVLNCGIYSIADKSFTIRSMCDRAQLVLRFLKDGLPYGFYNNQIEKNFTEEAIILSDIEEAIFNEVFEPFYQPIVDANTLEIVSAEALSRWIHPTKGVISPGVFIPVLEQRDMIPNLDSIIAKKVNAFMENRFEENKPFVPVSVNLSRVDLFDEELIKRINIILNESKVKNYGHRIEITESAYESLPENIVETLSSFKKLGAKILIDDFGSGYSSLGMITDYEFDIIKLDMKFASKIDSNEKSKGVIESLIRLAHSLDAKVVAEGVETESQYRFLKEAGCDLIQGYYFYKPMREAEFAKLLDEKLT